MGKTLVFGVKYKSQLTILTINYTRTDTGHLIQDKKMKKLSFSIMLLLVVATVGNFALADKSTKKSKSKSKLAKLEKARLKGKDKIHVSVKTVTGEELTGQIVKGNPKLHSTQIKVGRKKVEFGWINVLEYDLKFKDRPISTVREYFAAGKWLIRKKNYYPALLMFKQAYEKEPGLKAAIKKILKRKKIETPDWLGGEANFAEFFKYNSIRPTWQGALEHHQKADDWGKEMQKVLGSKKMHRFETTHFIVYSSYAKKHDRKLKAIFNKIYPMLAKIFTIPENEHLWIGKLPVYIFDTDNKFKKFSRDVTNTNLGGHGFQGSSGDFNYVVMGPGLRTQKKLGASFLTILVHETAHAFNSRYQNSRRIPNWLDEGIAEIAASNLVRTKNSGAPLKLRRSTSALKAGEKPDLDDLFRSKNIPLNSVYYGHAQSVVRYLIKKDHKKFLELYREYKSGTPGEEGLKKVFGLDYNDLMEEWIKAVTKKRR